MKFGKITAAIVASTLAVAPIAAQATVADRSAPIAGESEVGGESGIVIGLFAVLAIAIAVAASGGDDNDPVST